MDQTRCAILAGGPATTKPTRIPAQKSTSLSRFVIKDEPAETLASFLPSSRRRVASPTPPPASAHQDRAVMAARRNSFAALAPLDEDVEAISGIPPLAVVAAPTLAIDALAVGPLPSAGVAASSRAVSNPDTVVLPPKSVSMTADLSLNRKFSEVDTTVDDAEDGFTKVVSRKFGMRRGVANEVDTQPPEDEPEMEIPWGVKFGGNLREIKKWSQQTATGRAVTRMGPGIITHGSYGADGHET